MIRSGAFIVTNQELLDSASFILLYIYILYRKASINYQLRIFSIQSNVSLRSKAKREKQVVLEDIVALRNLVKKIRDQVLKGVGEADK